MRKGVLWVSGSILFLAALVLIIAIIGLLVGPQQSAATSPTAMSTSTTPSLVAHTVAKGHQRPTSPAPVPTSGAIQILSVSAEQATPSPGDTISLDYQIANGTGSMISAVLGASLSNAQNSFSDPSNDESVTLNTGNHMYRRDFVLPDGTANQTFDIVASVNAPGFTKEYDQERYPGAVSVGAGQQAPPVPVAINTPTPVVAGPAMASGKYTDSATSMSVTVSDVQAINDLTGASAVVFYVQLTNNDFSPHDFNSLDFQCVDAGNQAHQADALLPDPYGNASLDSGTLAAGDTRAGWVGCNMQNTGTVQITWDDSYNLEPPANVTP